MSSSKKLSSFLPIGVVRINKTTCDQPTVTILNGIICVVNYTAMKKWSWNLDLCPKSKFFPLNHMMGNIPSMRLYVQC